MPLSTDPDVGQYVTGAECEAYRDQVWGAVQALGPRIARLDPSSSAVVELQAAYLEFHHTVELFQSESCIWGSTTDRSIEIARTFNSFEERYAALAGGDGAGLPWSPAPIGSTSTATKVGRWLVGGLILAGVIGAGYWVLRRYTQPIRRLSGSRRRSRSLGAIRRKGPDGLSRYNLEIEK